MLIRLQVSSAWAGEPALATRHLRSISSSACFELQLKTVPEDGVSRRNRDLSPKGHRGGERPCLQGVTNNRGGSGPYIAISETVTQVSLYSQCRKTKRIICPTYLRSLVQGEVHCTVQVGQVSPTGGCHLAVQAFSPGMD